MDELQDFLEERARALEASSSKNPKRHETPKVQGYQSSGPSSSSCPVCSGTHRIYQCDRFKSSTIEQRRQIVKGKNLCFNCMRFGHNARACKSKSTCHECRKQHHTMLHSGDTTAPESAPVNSILGRKGQQSSILPTVEVSVHSRSGQLHKCRALLDSGSECSFISEDCLQRLQLQRKKSGIVVNGIGCSSNSSNRGKTIMTIIDKNDVSHQVEAFILPRLTSAIPSHPLQIKELARFPDIKLSDSSYAKPGNIDIILGVDV